MKLLGTYIAVLCTVITIVSCDAQKDAVNNNEIMELKTELDSVSYGIGVNIGKSLADQGMESLNTDAIAQAMSDVLGGSELKMNEEECMQIVTEYMKTAETRKSAGVIEAGKKFLEENGKRSSVVTLNSGLQYEIMTEGTGPKPLATDKVKTHYHGTLLNGDVFDSSVDRGEPISFPVNGVIKGWTEALQLMPVGSKWKLFIPSDLAYGERGAGAQIGPFSTLVFEVELIDIEK